MGVYYLPANPVRPFKSEPPVLQTAHRKKMDKPGKKWTNQDYRIIHKQGNIIAVMLIALVNCQC